MKSILKESQNLILRTGYNHWPDREKKPLFCEENFIIFVKKFLVGLLFLVLVPFSAYATPVALELALLVDVSGSVDDTEYSLQKQGYVNAFKSDAIQTLIANTPGGIAVTYIEWSGNTQQSMEVAWTHITNAASADAFAAAMASATRDFGGMTAPGSAINFGANSFIDNGFEGAKLVIDVSGDGEQNDGAATSTARTNAVSAGIQINGLAIVTEDYPSLDTWYTNNIMGGAGSFVITAEDFADFQNAVNTKIFREIGGQVPEPATMVLFGLGLLSLAGVSRKK